MGPIIRLESTTREASVDEAEGEATSFKRRSGRSLLVSPRQCQLDWKHPYCRIATQQQRASGESDNLRLGDQTLAHVLEALTHVQTKRGKVTLSYRELDVEQLKSLYESLLKRTVDSVEEQSGPLWRIRRTCHTSYGNPESTAQARRGMHSHARPVRSVRESVPRRETPLRAQPVP